MPQGPDHLRERFGDEMTAWSLLAARGWKTHRGIFWREGPPRLITKDEGDAADYLVLEWDWSWESSDPRRPFMKPLS